MLVVEILIAVGVACIATALLGILTDADGDRLVPRDQLTNNVEGADKPFRPRQTFDTNSR